MDSVLTSSSEESDREAWEGVKLKHPVGSIVEGTVFQKAPYGAWIDIGEQFKCLLEIVRIPELTPEMYREDRWCPINSPVSARIIGHDDRNRQIRLSQESEERPVDDES